jgi:glycosyltransferase involved in cell wall biosynthesis
METAECEELLLPLEPQGVKPRILIVHYGFLPGEKVGGSALSIAAQAQALHEDFEFRLLTSDRDINDPTPYEGIPQDEWLDRDGMKIMYLSPSGRSFLNLWKLVSGTGYDLLYLNSCFSRRFSMLPALLWRLGLARRVPLLIAPRGEFSRGALAIKPWRKRLFLLFAAAIGLYRGVRWHASTALEREDIQRARIATSEVIVARDLTLDRVRDADIAREPKMPGQLRAAFLSRISRKKNLDGALRILRDVRGAVAFSIYGPNEDRAYWSECEALISELPVNVTVRYLGQVSHAAVPEVFSRNDLFLFPTHGENFGHVILEALLAGCPVLLSDQTPWRNLAANHAGWDLPLADSRGFVEVIENCVAMTDQEHRQWSAGARALGLREAHDPLAVEGNRRLFLDLLDGQRRAPASGRGEAT